MVKYSEVAFRSSHVWNTPKSPPYWYYRYMLNVFSSVISPTLLLLVLMSFLYIIYTRSRKDPSERAQDSIESLRYGDHALAHDSALRAADAVQALVAHSPSLLEGEHIERERRMECLVQSLQQKLTLKDPGQRDIVIPESDLVNAFAAAEEQGCAFTEGERERIWTALERMADISRENPPRQ